MGAHIFVLWKIIKLIETRPKYKKLTQHIDLQRESSFPLLHKRIYVDVQKQHHLVVYVHQAFYTLFS